jgi:hypothetical protein
VKIRPWPISIGLAEKSLLIVETEWVLQHAFEVDNDDSSQEVDVHDVLK